MVCCTLADTGNNTIRISTFVAPRIHANQANGLAVLSWRNSAPNYSVESTSNVVVSASWTPVIGAGT